MPLYPLFSQHVAIRPNHAALVVDEVEYSYAALQGISNGIAEFLHSQPGFSTGLLAHRSITAYSGILGILQSGNAYVPLNPKFPVRRNASIAALARFNTLIVGRECINYLQELMDFIPETMQFVFPDCTVDEIPQFLSQNRHCHFVSATQNFQHFEPKTELGYILFTSGSTGVPKGVPVKKQSVVDYVTYLHKRYNPQPNDRFSQTFDLTFDLSVHDIFLCWNAGATLFALPEKAMLGPSKFIRNNGLTFWFSVPSVAQFMDTFRMLKPNVFPTLRCSLFCGEPLPLSIALKWQEATGGQLTENIYGPTEGTIGITHYTIPELGKNVKSKNGIVSIGTIFSSQKMRIVEEENSGNSAGELWLSGTQIADGYWNNDEKTKLQFYTDSQNITWYKTGDLVSLDADGDLFYEGRTDFQIKIRGYRIELEEINYLIADFIKDTLVYSIPWPMEVGSAESIYTFVSSNCKKNAGEILEFIATKVADYMVPKDIIFVQEFPLNANGKIDKLALAKSIEKNG